jgi:phosphopantothenoylcysteine decarboxylase/phosphopantothenate--cysteine ligase
MSSDRRVALAVCGSIAAYKAVEVARLLVAGGVAVTPLMTRSAERFLGPETLAGIAGASVLRDMFDASYPGELHVDLARGIDLLLVVPATADMMARLASGRADDLVTALALCFAGPVLLAPAMHSRMWMHPATRRNAATLDADRRVRWVGPVEGALASGEIGPGRLADPTEIAAAVLRELGPRDLGGLRIVVSAGPTVEDIDPVRFVGNRSSGKMGFAVAERAACRGAEVTLVTGPVSLSTPARVRRVDVRSALEMKAALEQALGTDLGAADALVMSAAVADYRPREAHSTKLKKAGDSLSLALVKNPDLLADIGARRAAAGAPGPVLVGFAVETGDASELLAYATEKLRTKRVDMIVANQAGDAFGKNTNQATLVLADATAPLPPMSKSALADQILDRVRALCAARGGRPC